MAAMTPAELNAVVKPIETSVAFNFGESKLLISSNPDRVFLQVCGATNKQYNLSTKPITAANPGFQILSNTLPWSIDIHQAPGLVGHEWYAQDVGLNNAINVLEAIVLPLGKGTKPTVD